MTSNHSAPFVSKPVKEMTPGSHSLIRNEVKSWVPAGMLQMNWIESRIGNLEELLAARRNNQRHVIRCVSWCRKGLGIQDTHFLELINMGVLYFCICISVFLGVLYSELCLS